MSELTLTLSKSHIWRAARQEALRWQALLGRVPLFLGTVTVLIAFGLGMLSTLASQNMVIQGLVLLGYALVYWVLFLITRLIQGFLRSYALRRALFRIAETREIQVHLGAETLSVKSGHWGVQLAASPSLRVYGTRDFLFLQSPLMPWLPLPKSQALRDLLQSARTQKIQKKGAAEAAPQSD